MNEASSSQNETIQTLVNLGLTVLQAKVYIALAKLGTSTGRTTAKQAKVASQDVYRILNELQEKGLIEKIIAKPATYKALPIKEGLSILLQNKKEEYIETEKQAKKILYNFCEINQSFLQEKLEFTIVSELNHTMKLHGKLAGISKNKIDFVCSGSDKILFYYCSDYIKEANARGVKIRAIAQKANAETSAETPKSSYENPLFELRYLPENVIPFGIHIFDRKEVTLSASNEPTPSLKTNSPHVVKLAEAHFESLWNAAQTN
jgi:sugar-specific transcriptional regulator TrmB